MHENFQSHFKKIACHQDVRGTCGTCEINTHVPNPDVSTSKISAPDVSIVKKISRRSPTDWSRLTPLRCGIISKPGCSGRAVESIAYQDFCQILPKNHLGFAWFYHTRSHISTISWPISVFQYKYYLWIKPAYSGCWHSPMTAIWNFVEMHVHARPARPTHVRARPIWKSLNFDVFIDFQAYHGSIWKYATQNKKKARHSPFYICSRCFFVQFCAKFCLSSAE